MRRGSGQPHVREPLRAARPPAWPHLPSDMADCGRTRVGPPRCQPEVWVCEAPVSSPISRFRANKLSVRSLLRASNFASNLASIWPILASRVSMRLLSRHHIVPSPPRMTRKRGKFCPVHAAILADSAVLAHVRPAAPGLSPCQPNIGRYWPLIMGYSMPSTPGCWLFTGPANQPQGGKGGRSPLLRFPGGGRGFWAEPASPKRAAYASRFRARGLYTIKRRLADFGRSAKYLKRLSFCCILAGPRSLR